MRLIRSYAATPAAAKGAVVAIGNFDGVHLGHQRLIAKARAIANDAGRALAILTFEPHPRSVFQPQAPPFRLTPLRRKVRLLGALGVEQVVAIPFNLAFAAKPAETFVREVLVDALAAHHVVIGYDFAFGHRRMGDPEMLGRLGRAHGFGVTVVIPQSDGGEPFAASRVRDFLGQGKVAAATAELGRYWEIDGHVRHGDARGRALGFPTANVKLAKFLQPALGIYAVRVGLGRGADLRWHDGVAYLGPRPTFAGTEVLLEVHLFAFDRDLYGRHLRAALVDFVRPDRTFTDVDALKRQIAADCEAARTLLARHRESDRFFTDNTPTA